MLDNPFSQRVNAVIQKTREMRRGVYYPHLYVVKEDGERKTATHGEMGCIFNNDPGFEGGFGCALHHLAAREGVSFIETKPEVCWQLPTRRSYDTAKFDDGKEYQVVVIGEFDRRGWGEGGHDLDWYCSGDPIAHVGTEPVYKSNRDELVALLLR